MNLLIINCSPRTAENSNTEKIIAKFAEGYSSRGDVTELYRLSDRQDWQPARTAFAAAKMILFALPLFAECVPGIMMEFLETLEPKEENDGELGFLVQGCYPEASQLRCCQRYLEKLPSYLNCEYAGTLIKGDMFGVYLADAAEREAALQPFVEAGKQFAVSHRFDEEEVNYFARPEYFSGYTLAFKKFMLPCRQSYLRNFAEKLGCSTSLRARPYAGGRGRRRNVEDFFEEAGDTV